MDMSMRVLDWQALVEGALGIHEQTAMTIGVFDGVHRGHQALIAKILHQGFIPTVITFRQNPKRILSPETYGGDILSLPQKLAIFEDLGVSQTILIDFSENFSTLKGQEFIDALIRWGKLAYLVIGSNFRCGYRLDTDATLIRGMNAARGITTEVVPPVEDGALPVSSSRIRAAIVAGDFTRARAALGRNVAIDLEGLPPLPGTGGVIFDLVSSYRVIPPEGRYRVVVYEQGKHNAEKGRVVEISLREGKICIPLDGTAPWHGGYIEFVSQEAFPQPSFWGKQP
ncbi:MAG: FAD synthetase family protein [Treponema sp.]|jgi:riboflavin kinase/FMN adenylyltransferase|nr:FAD synthetase family protein [Treponema sp.]